MKKVTWKKIDGMYIADCEGHMAQDKTLIKATNKAARKAYKEDGRKCQEENTSAKELG